MHKHYTGHIIATVLKLQNFVFQYIGVFTSSIVICIYPHGSCIFIIARALILLSWPCDFQPRVMILIIDKRKQLNVRYSTMCSVPQY